MDPVTIFVVLFVASEILDGGAVTASAAGAIGAGAKAAAAETAKGAKGWYKKRAKGMRKTGWGRARLRAEAATAGAVAFLGRGVKAGAKAAPGGAKSGWAKGRQVRDGAVTVARQKLADGTAKVRARGASGGLSEFDCQDCGGLLGSHDDDCPRQARRRRVDSMDPTTAERADQGQWRKPGDGTADPRVEITGETVHADDFTYAPDTELRQLAAGGNQAAARELMRRASMKSERDQEAMDDEPASELNGWTDEEQHEARAVADTGRCCWVIRDQGWDGPRELCGTPIRKGYIFCVEHLGELHEQADQPDRFRFDSLDIDAGEALDSDDFFHPSEYEEWLEQNYDEDGNPIQQSPASGGGESKGDAVAEAVAEDKGAGPYVQGWEDEADGYEGLIAAIEGKRDRLRASADVNTRHEVGGVDDATSRLDAAVEAIQAAWEGHKVHAGALRDKWSHELLQRMHATEAESARETAGAH